MGSKKEFNWVLKLSDNLEDLVEGEVRTFEKDEARVYPTNIPIFLADSDWNIPAAIKILEYTESGDKTSGKYEIVRVFSALHKKLLSGIYKDLYSGN